MFGVASLLVWFGTMTFAFRSEGTMDLKESKFYYAGEVIKFTLFSDQPCRARYLESFPVPFTQTPVDVYAIDPGAHSQWVVIQEVYKGRSRLNFFIREGETFRRKRRHQIPRHLRRCILQRLPKQTRDGQPSFAA